MGSSEYRTLMPPHPATTVAPPVLHPEGEGAGRGIGIDLFVAGIHQATHYYEYDACQHQSNACSHHPSFLVSDTVAVYGVTSS